MNLGFLGRKIKIYSIFLIVIVAGCKKESSEPNLQLRDANLVHIAMQNLTKAMVHDIFSPPVASRIYAYPSIAAYQVVSAANPEYKSLAGQLNGLTETPSPHTNKSYSYELAALQAFYKVGSKMVFSTDITFEFEDYLDSEIKRLKIPNEIVQRSKDYGDSVAIHILNWANKDNYNETRSSTAYDIDDRPGSWKPTPPAYMPGIEPHWNTIRPFVLDSASQFVPSPPSEYSLATNSKFYKELMEVYNKGLNLNREEEAIAKFWDCNPYVAHNKGHVMFASKKITPGGHWIGITEIACKKSNFNFIETVDAYAKVSIGMADAFISCWDEKWRSNLIRPETVINEYFDDDWAPLLQTPPFPEHTSGHSVVSSAASVVLTSIFGDNFEFDDTSEIPYGLPVRSFQSFKDAAAEAAISRLYGGIHYMPAITYGLDQGSKVGDFVLKNVNTKNFL